MTNMQKVTFEAVDGTPLVGDLHVPDGNGPHPAVVILGPCTFVKEQSPTEYAKRLAAKGYVALAFDPRYRGESGGQPRLWENPPAKVQDVISAVAFLASRDEVDATRIAGLGICQGAPAMVRAVTENPAIRVFATVAGQYRDHDATVEWVGEEVYTSRLTKGKAAREKYEKTGEVDYIPACSETDTYVAMPGKYVWDWYHHWSDRGIWENRYAALSDVDLLTFESLSAAKQVQTPWMMVHSDGCIFPEVAKRHFEAAPTNDKKLVWEGKTYHTDFYDKPVTIDPAVDKFDKWYRDHLV